MEEQNFLLAENLALAKPLQSDRARGLVLRQGLHGGHEFSLFIWRLAPSLLSEFLKPYSERLNPVLLVLEVAAFQVSGGVATFKLNLFVNFELARFDDVDVLNV